MAKINNAKGRGPNIKQSDALILMGACGGTCEFRGCGKPLISDKTTGDYLNFSNFAHIIASSPKGPRGNENSHSLANKPENFIILCPEHHKLIDSPRKEEKFSAEDLISMRNEHREKVQRFRNSLKLPAATVLVFTGSFSNNIVVIDSQLAASSIYPLFSSVGETTRIEISSPEGMAISSSAFWKSVKNSLDRQFTARVLNVLEEKRPLAVFALAPIPCLAYLGLKLGCGTNTRLFPIYRDHTLGWKSFSPTLTFKIKELKNNQADATNLLQALLVEISGRVDRKKVLIEGLPPSMILSLQIDSPEIDCVKSPEDLDNFSKKYIEVLDRFDNSKPIHIFAAVPQTIALEMGRQLLSKHGEVVVMHCVNNEYVKGFSFSR